MNNFDEILRKVEPLLALDEYVPLVFHVTALSRNQWGTKVSIDIYDETGDGTKVLDSITAKIGMDTEFSPEATRVLRYVQKSPDGVSKRKLGMASDLNLTR